MRDAKDVQLLRSQFMSSVRGVADSLLESNKSTSFKATGQAFAWNTIPWAWFGRLETYHILAKIEHITPDDVVCVLGKTEITPDSLRNGLPRASTDMTEWGIYLIVGHHIDGTWALYVGSSTQMGIRIGQHALDVRIVRTRKGNVLGQQYCHKILGGNGWSVTYHKLAVFEKATSTIWLHTIETIFIILFNAISPEAKSNQHNEACAQLYDRLVQNALPIVSTTNKDKNCQASPPPIDAGEGCQSLDPPINTIIGLNRALPIKQGFRSNHSKLKIKCEQCQAENTTGRWYCYDTTRPYESYHCSNCHRSATRTEVQQKRLEEFREVRKVTPVLDKCGSCGTDEGRLYRCTELGMVLCRREYAHFQKWGTLSPNGGAFSKGRASMKALFPTLEKCGSCGTTEGILLRCAELQMVLCGREYQYWKKHGQLSPKRKR